uniref:Uncharacterized protein n=1 Tax=Quercus lobata TaxID=97700 RepID=A0A7N2MKD5_QUELO
MKQELETKRKCAEELKDIEGHAHMHARTCILSFDLNDERFRKIMGPRSEGETLYSEEADERGNYTSPREGKFQQVGQSQSCVIYKRSGIVQRNSVARGKSLEKQRSCDCAETYSRLVIYVSGCFRNLNKPCLNNPFKGVGRYYKDELRR